MPATSQAQHGFMGMVLRYKRGELKESEIPAGVRKKVKAAAASMSEQQVSDFTSTSTKRLPKHVGNGPRAKLRKVRSA